MRNRYFLSDNRLSIEISTGASPNASFEFFFSQREVVMRKRNILAIGLMLYKYLSFMKKDKLVTHNLESCVDDGFLAFSINQAFDEEEALRLVINMCRYIKNANYELLENERPSIRKLLLECRDFTDMYAKYLGNELLQLKNYSYQSNCAR